MERLTLPGLLAAGDGRERRSTARARGRAGAGRCPRLVAWREQVAREKRAAFRDWDYWGRPVPGFGDPRARVRARRPRARRPRRQPHRPRVHRRPLRRLALRRAAPRRLRQPADRRSPRRRPARCATLTSRPPSAARRPPTSRRPTSATPACRFSSASCALLDDARVIVCLGAFAWDAAAAAALGAVAAPAPALRPRRRGRADGRARCSAATTRASRTRSPAS